MFALREVPADDGVMFRFDCEREPAGEWLVDASLRHPNLRFTYEFVDEFGEHGRHVGWIAGVVLGDEDVPPRSLAWVDWKDEET